MNIINWLINWREKKRLKKRLIQLHEDALRAWHMRDNELWNSSQSQTDIILQKLKNL